MTQEDPNNSMQTHHPEEAVSGALSIRPSLADQSGIVELPAGFSTAKAGARLRQQLGRRLNAMSSEDRKLFDDDAQIVTLAVNVFFEELLMMADAWFQTTDREPDEAAFHDFLSQETLHAWMLGWAEKILGIKAR